MNEPDRLIRGRRLRPTRWWVLAAVLVLVGSGCLEAGLREHQHPLAGPAPQRASPPATDTSPEPPQAVIRSVPVLLTIPAIGLAVSVSEVGLNPDGTVEVPTDVQQPGWFQLGPSPGQLGSAVILGHVDSYRGPAVFFQLGSLVDGEQVQVSLADGAVANFAISTVAMYSKTQFPDDQVYASHGYSALQLVTCGGTFDTQTGHYLSNIVVYSSLVSISQPSAKAGNPGS
jgi:hypothetical protein